MFQGIAALVAFLSGFTHVRVADVQTVEFVIVFALALSFLQPREQARLEGPAVIINLLPRVLLMLALTACGALLSLRLQFYPPTAVGGLRQPPWATIARLVEVAISVSSLFVVALAVRDDPRKLKLLLAAYGWAAIANAVWGLIAFASYYSGLILPGITISGRIPRISGFFNEGGPLGVYLAGGALIQYIRGPILNHISRPMFWASMVVIGLAIVGSQSKAAVLVLILLASLSFLQQRRASLMVAAFALIIPIAIASNLLEGINGYYQNLVNFREEAYERSEDGNLVNGRLMASVILPRIVEAHPVLGVGIGNYSLIRNDPDILLGLPRTENWDLHGLGLLGYLAELGIPLTLFVFYVYGYPLLNALRSRPWIFQLSAYPLLAALFGVQLNFAYPWVVMGLALAALSIERKHRSKTLPVVIAAPAQPLRRRAARRPSGT